MTERVLTFFLGLSLAIIICWLLNLLQFVFLPLAIAVLISFLLNPMVAWLTRHKVPLFLAAPLTILLTVLVVYLAGAIVLSSLVSFQKEFPRYEAKIEDMVTKAEQLSRLNIGPLGNDRLKKEFSRLSLSSIVASTLSSAFNLLWYLLLIIVFLIYLVFGRPRLPRKIRRAFSDEKAVQINEAIENFTLQVQRYMWAKTLTSIITGGMVIIICLLFEVDFPITWGFFAFLLNFIPTIGVMLAAVLPTLVALVQFGWVTAFWFILVTAAVMIILGNIIEPKILGESVNLSPLVALFALIFWGWLWGAAGMVVAVPLTAIIKFSCDHVQVLRPIGALMGGEV